MYLERLINSEVKIFIYVNFFNFVNSLIIIQMNKCDFFASGA
jgi:hypothetical protein